MVLAKAFNVYFAHQNLLLLFKKTKQTKNNSVTYLVCTVLNFDQGLLT